MSDFERLSTVSEKPLSVVFPTLSEAEWVDIINKAFPFFKQNECTNTSNDTQDKTNIP